MIVPCPICKGNPLAVTNPFEQYMDWPCQTCLGKGTVDTEMQCACGRPAVRDVGTIMVCSNSDCIDTALGKQEDKPMPDWRDTFYSSIYMGD